MESLEISQHYELTGRDLVKDRVLQIAPWVAPVALSVVPAAVLFILGLVLAASPPATAVFFFFALVSLIAGLLIGLGIAGGLFWYRQSWLRKLREMLAVDGIRAEEVRFFMHELSGQEKRALREIEKSNRLLGDAYRETLASRLTASRILKTTKKELFLIGRREGKLKLLKTENAGHLREELSEDRARMQEIQKEGKAMKAEAETRLQMIEAASRRGTSFADTELALKKLSARSEQLPLALEAVKMEEDLRRELEAEAKKAGELAD
jgi:hypothetical protein